jgi:hypothetical protein
MDRWVMRRKRDVFSGIGSLDYVGSIGGGWGKPSDNPRHFHIITKALPHQNGKAQLDRLSTWVDIEHGQEVTIPL